MKRAMRWVAAVVCAAGLVATANAGAGVEVGARLWYVMFADPVASDGAGNALSLDDALMIGPKIQWSSPEGRVWMSLMGMIGQTRFTDAAGNSGDDFTLADGELVAGLSFSWIDFGAGFRYTTWQMQSSGDSLNMYGPMLYVGTGSTFGRSPLGWYFGGSVMFLDLGDIEDNLGESGEHYNVEGGIFFSKRHFSATLGFRYKGFMNYSDAQDAGDLTQMGPALSLIAKF